MIQTNIVNPLNALIGLPLNQGVLIKGVALSNSQDNQVPTGLGRPYVGWIVTRVAKNTRIYETNEYAETTSSVYLTLSCTTSATCDILIF